MPFGGWRPDSPELSEWARQAKNVLPGEEGDYHPALSFQKQSTTLTTSIKGFISANTPAGATYLYAGTADGLYEASGSLTWVDESKGGGYTTLEGDVWEFVVWDRNNEVLACNGAQGDPIQSMSIGAGGATAFADMITSTNKPKASHMTVVRNQVLLGNVSSADGYTPSRIWWSAVNDPTDFDPDSRTQCDYETLQFGGAVQGVIGGAEYAVVFQEYLIRRMQYVGPGVVYEIVAVDRKRGTPLPNSIVAHGRNIYYISEEGFFVFDGTQSTPLGINKVDKTFWRDFDLAGKHKMSAAIMPLDKTVIWSTPLNGGGNKTYNFRWDTGEWTETEYPGLQRLATANSPSYTLEELDAAFGNNIDTDYSDSWDSDTYAGGKQKLVGFQDRQLGYFSGPALKAVIETKEMQLNDGDRSQINLVRPLVDNPNLTLSVGTRTRLSDPVVYGTPATMNTVGECPVRTEGRYARFRISLSGGTSTSVSWSHAQGIDLMDVVMTGGR